MRLLNEPVACIFLRKMLKPDKDKDYKRRLPNASWVGFVSTVLLSLFAFTKVRTYVVVSDPTTYLRIAHQVLKDHASLTDFLASIDYVAPGYPLLLALFIKCLGSFGFIWVNLLFFILLLFVFHQLYRTLGLSDWSVSLCTLATLYFAFTGYQQNVHYLLYPYRSSVVMFFMFLSILLVLKYEQSGWKACGIAAGFSLSLGIFVREAAAILGLPLFLYFLIGPRESLKQRMRKLFVVFSPVLGSGFLLLGISMATGRKLNYQVEAYLRKISNDFAGEGQFWDHFPHELETWVGMAQNELGIWGVFFLGVGIFVMAKRRVYWFLFVFPALLYACFYATFFMHPRYFLRSFFFIIPLAAIGLSVSLTYLYEKLLNKWGLNRSAFFLLICMILSGAIFMSVKSLEPWSSQVSKEQIRKIRECLASVLGDEGYCVIEYNCLELYSALVDYGLSDQLISGTKALSYMAKVPVFYINPLKASAYSNGPRKHVGLNMEKTLKHQLNLIRPEVSNPDVLKFSLGTEIYELLELVPWSSRVIDRKDIYDSETDDDVILWIDFESVKPDQVHRVHVINGEGLNQSYAVSGRGWKGFFLSHDMLGNRVDVQISSDDVIPRNPKIVVRKMAQGGSFFTNYKRTASAKYLFGNGIRRNESEKFIGVLTKEQGRLTLPQILGGPFQEMDVLLELSTGGHYNEDVQIEILQNEKVVADYKGLPVKGAAFAIKFRCSYVDENEISLVIKANNLEGKYGLRFEKISMYPK